MADDINNMETPKKFDVVICLEVLEHVEDDCALLKDLLKHGKRLLISVPAKQKLFDASDEAVGHYRRYEINFGECSEIT